MHLPAAYAGRELLPDIESRRHGGMLPAHPDRTCSGMAATGTTERNVGMLRVPHRCIAGRAGSWSLEEVVHEGLATGSQPGLRLGHCPHPPASCLTRVQAGAGIDLARIERVEPPTAPLQVPLDPRMQRSDFPGQLTDAHAHGGQRTGDEAVLAVVPARSPQTNYRRPVRSIRSRHCSVASRLSWRATRSTGSGAAGASASVRMGPRELAQSRYSHTCW
jgi:hypothetical protein